MSNVHILEMYYTTHCLMLWWISIWIARSNGVKSLSHGDPQPKTGTSPPRPRLAQKGDNWWVGMGPRPRLAQKRDKSWVGMGWALRGMGSPSAPSPRCHR
ncbi:hypothetical protein OWV82_024310 [Melia azedarach]|uniref:Uncharacterized protein n=1 Tax=Melia azedarach TaxID=155640 RepID=A0ACC1WPB8_MELAZ|nr:hypothetical protein OWV82_024310 [Melia azedarach]